MLSSVRDCLTSVKMFENAEKVLSMSAETSGAYFVILLKSKLFDDEVNFKRSGFFSF